MASGRGGGAGLNGGLHSSAPVCVSSLYFISCSVLAGTGCICKAVVGFVDNIVYWGRPLHQVGEFRPQVPSPSAIEMYIKATQVGLVVFPWCWGMVTFLHGAPVMHILMHYADTDALC